ncbi:putative glutathione peroxidase 1-like, partial [Apostichopus japonicus]
ENSKNEEIQHILEHVRPGNGFKPKFPLFKKIEVNGANTHPIFNFLKTALPMPSDDPYHLLDDPSKVIWRPLQRNDLKWNFEKFLVGTDGVPFKRYGPSFETKLIAPEIEALLQS